MSLRTVEVLNAVAAIRRRRRTRQRGFIGRLAFHYRLKRERHGLGRIAALRKAWRFAR
jgi:hypothetical protein